MGRVLIVIFSDYGGSLRVVCHNRKIWIFVTILVNQERMNV